MGQRFNGVVKRLCASAALDESAASDGELLARFVTERDGEAFAALVRRHGPMVLSVCRRVLRDRHDAEDAFQATFLVLAKKAGSVLNLRFLGGWLHGVAHRSALAARRAAAVRRKKESRIAEMALHEATPEGPPAELLALLDRELTLLPDRYRVPVVLCDLEGLTRKEAARRLGWREGTLAGRLFRARAILAKRMSRQGLSISGGLLAASLSEAAGACPTSLVTTTTQAAIGAAAGHVTAVSAAVLSITQGVLKTMLITKLKVVTAGLLVGCLVVGTGAAGYRALASEPGSDVAQAKRDEPMKGGRPEADLEQLRRELAEARREAAAQRDRAEALAREKELLQYYQRLSLAQRDSKEDVRLKQLLADRDQLLGEQAQIKSKLDGVEAEIAQLKTAIVLSASALRRPDGMGPIGMMLKATGPDGPMMGGADRAPREAGRLVMRTYQVGELVTRAEGGEVEKGSDNLIALVTQMVAPTTWSTRGGDGSIAYFARTRTLFVVQTADVQKQVADMLEQLRQLASQQQKAHEMRGPPGYPSGTGTNSPLKQ
jgi:RNA polymerase sigma factor (sigma-70 family)